MDKKLKNYEKYLAAAAKQPNAELIKFHQAELQQFQHERLIHLIVTLSFVCFLLFFFGLFLFLSLSYTSEGGVAQKIMMYGAGGVTLLLLVVVLFYVRHYYLLENGVQRLEEYTAKLYGREYGKKKKA